MTERTHIPGSPACGQWETLLADALDGLLKLEDEAVFAAHKAACPACAALYEEARRGREWLEFLAPEPEMPAGLVDRILAHTGPGNVAAAGWTAGGRALPAAGPGAIPAFVPPVRHPSDLDLSLGAPVWRQPGFFARLRYAVQPRLLMTAAMAFFSIALTLNLAGVRLTTLRLADLRPRALRSYMERQLTMASVPIVRYYDHLQLMSEVESRVRELRGQDEGEGGGGAEPQRKEAQPATPGQTKEDRRKSPGSTRGGSRVDPPQQADSPAMEPAAGQAGDFLETSFVFQGRPSQSGGSSPHGRRPVRGGPGAALRAWKRSTAWIA
jgi:hypothetical protein